MPSDLAEFTTAIPLSNPYQSLVYCLKCGAPLILDSRAKFSPEIVHSAWHMEINEQLSKAHEHTRMGPY